MAAPDECMQEANFTRLDGRAPDEIRAEFGCELGTLGAADGSASLQLGTTEALVAVYGPRPAESRAAYQNEAQIQATVTFAKFSGMTPKPNQGPDRQQKALEELLETVFSKTVPTERFPKAVISVHAFLSQCGGSEGAALVMAGAMALVQAHIDMRFLPSAASVVTHGEHMLVDPTRAEQNAADRHVIVVMDNPKNRVIHMEASGIFPAAEFADALDLGADVCAFYDQLLRTAATSYCAAECKALQSA